jgi:hypothetical protein
MNPLPVVNSLLRILQDHKFTLVSWHGVDAVATLEGTPRERRQKAKRLICEEGSGVVVMSHPLKSSCHVSIILDGEPEESVGHNDGPVALLLALQQFRKKWDGKGWPSR